jgi:hypothetical protein
MQQPATNDNSPLQPLPPGPRLWPFFVALGVVAVLALSGWGVYLLLCAAVRNVIGGML